VKRTPYIVTLTASGALTVSGCFAHLDSTQSTGVDKTPPQLPAQPLISTMTNPPVPIDSNNSTSSLPTWDEVTSDHPMGATNPPVPVLAIQPDTIRCYKEWYAPRRDANFGRDMDGDPSNLELVLPSGSFSGGTEIQCPQERTNRSLAYHKAGEIDP